MTAESAQQTANQRLWQRDDLVKLYANRELRPVEATLLLRHRDALSSRVLELGCGAGRLTGYLDEIADEVTAIDVSPQMLAAVKERYPRVQVERRDLRDLSAFADGSFETVVAGFNVVDVLDDDQRASLLSELLRILTPGGLLIFSTHNRGAEHRTTEPFRPQLERPRELLALILHGLKWRRNRRRLLPHERHEREYAILNDLAHDFEALHYYIDRDAQARQLEKHGYEFVECLDQEGREVARGDAAAHATDLHYVARRPAGTVESG